MERKVIHSIIVQSIFIIIVIKQIEALYNALTVEGMDIQQKTAHLSILIMELLHLDMVKQFVLDAINMVI